MLNKVISNINLKEDVFMKHYAPTDKTSRKAISSKKVSQDHKVIDFGVI